MLLDYSIKARLCLLGDTTLAVPESQFPTPHSSPLVSLSHLSISPASPSLTIFGCVPAASQLSAPFHICLSPRLLLLSVSLPLIVFFLLHLDISLVSFRLLLPRALCILSGRHHLFFLCHLLCFSSHPDCFRCSFHLCSTRVPNLERLTNLRKKSRGISISDRDQLAKRLKTWPFFKFQGNFT